MALCPFATIKLLHPEDVNEPRITPTQLIEHTAVSDAQSLWGYFQRADVNVESTFYIAEHGELEQYMDTERQADAQFDGNLHGNSVECWDGRNPNVPLNPAQLATFLRLARWWGATHHVALVKCAGPQAPGLGYHSLFHEWAKDGHTCPNPPKIEQFNNVILPALAGGEDDMTDAQAALLEGVHSDVWALTAKVDALAAQVAALKTGAVNAVALTDADVMRVAQATAKATIAEIAS